MIAEQRPIRPDEVEVIRATLERARVELPATTAVASLGELTVVARCECGCGSVDFDSPPSRDPSKPLGDGIGTGPRGGEVGVIVWGRRGAIAGLEVYDLGAGDGALGLPSPASIVPWRQRSSG